MSKSVALLLVLVFLIASCIATTNPVWAPPADSWESKAPMPQGGAIYGAAVVNGKIYAFGGYYYNGTTYYTSEEYNPATDTWAIKAPMPTPRIEFAIAAYEGKIYVIGGKTSQAWPVLNYTEVYDPATNTWATKAPMPTARADMQANMVNGKIYVIGGWLSQFYTPNANEVYDPRTDTWASAMSIPNAVSGYASAVVDNKIYIIGGDKPNVKTGPTDAFDTNQIYDPATDKWTFGTPLPNAVGEAVAGATTGAMAPKRIYVFGGHDKNGNPSYLNQVYDPKINDWTTGAKLAQGFGYSAVAVLNDTLYVIDGDYSEAETDMFMQMIYNPPPPFSAANHQYIPIGYGTPDRTAPEIAVLSLEKTYSSGNVSLIFTVNKPVVWMGYSLDGQEIVTITGNTTIAGLTSGLHNVTVYAKDAFENSGASETSTFSIEVPFPTVLVAAAGMLVAIVGVCLLVYFKKRKH